MTATNAPERLDHSSSRYAMLFLAGTCVLGYEILLTRAASAFFQYHFAFLVLSTAMLSLFASGVLYQRLSSVGDRHVLISLWALFGVLALSPTLFTTAIGVNIRRLELLSGGFVVLLTGSFVTLHWLRASVDPGRAYAANLFGSAMGAALATFALIWTAPEAGVLLLAALASIAIILNTRRPSQGAFALAALLASAGFCWTLLPDPNVLWQRWNSFSYIQVVNQRGPVIWGSHAGLPPSLDLLIDSSADTAILTDLATKARLEAAQAIAKDITHVGYALAPQPLDVAIVGSGGGRDVIGAELFHPRSILAIEINPSVIEAVRRFSPATYASVDVEVAEGRSALERSRSQFSIIQFGLVDTWAAVSSGTFALSENYLYTRQAIAGYLRRLRPNGVLSMTRWGSERDRLMAIAEAGLHDVGVASADGHVLLVEKDAGSDSSLVTALIRREGWDPAHVAEARASAQSVGYKLVDNPSSMAKPADDDSPFFFYTVEGSHVIFQSIAMLGAVSIAIFLAARPRAFEWHLPTFAYFGAIGLGYMLVENVYLQKFILLIRNPTIAVSTVFVGFLLFSALGSFMSRLARGWSTFLIVPFLFLFFATSPRIIARSLTSAIGLKIAVTIACIAPAALLMGLFLPIGFQRVTSSRRSEAMAWAVNGLCSVLAPPVALLLAVHFGFGVVLVVAMLLYALAAAVMSQL